MKLAELQREHRAASYVEIPTSITDAREMRAAAISELGKIHAQLAKVGMGSMREWLKVEAVKSMARIAAVNDWIRDYSNSQGSITRPSKEYRQTVKVIGAPAETSKEESETATCQCGEVAVSSRSDRARVFYCTTCGKGWEVEAPRLHKAPRPATEKMCRCSRACRFCGGRRR